MGVKRPNILFIITDQQRADHLSCAGNPVLKTPYIDLLAERGRRFENFYVNSGCLLYTSPSPRDATLSRMPSSA